MNGDGNLNVLDVVELINQILSGENTTEGDINGDGGNNILDVVALVNLVLN